MHTDAENTVAGFFRRHAGVVAVLLVAGIVALTRIPFRFEWWGEQDQARFLVDSILFRYEGVDILRKHFLYTSPLCLVGFALLAKIFGNAALLPISNALGLAAGVIMAVAVYLLSRTFAIGRLWSASIAIASSLLPGIFMTSLYGYPTIYALPFGVAAAAAVSVGVTRDQRAAKLRWFGLACVAFTLLLAMKMDFSLFGTALFAVVILKRRVTVENILLLLAVAVISGLVVFLAATPLRAGAVGFGTSWAGVNAPFKTLNTGLSTLWLTVGWGTLFFLATGFAALLFAGKFRQVTTPLAAWLVGAFPIWLFWGTIPPISTRHAVPGALFTAFVLGWIAARLFPKRRVVALLFPIVLVASNWPWGAPSYDLNYYLGGDLIESYRVNRRAFAACRVIVDKIATAESTAQIFVREKPTHRLYVNALETIDIIPMIRYELASQATQVRNQLTPRSNYNLETHEPAGKRVFFVCTQKRLAAAIRSQSHSRRKVIVNSLTGKKELPHLPRDRDVELRTFDVQAEYDRLWAQLDGPTAP